MFAPTETELREMGAKEFGMIDDSVDMLLRALDGSGLADNTIIVFTSDYGVMLKGAMHYAGSTRVTLLMKVPGQFAARVAV
jgi:arylsulfatase A-like enzyme